MARCGCGGGCNCVVQVHPDWATCVQVPGNGSAALPYRIGLILETASGNNLLQCTPEGLLVDVSAIPPIALMSGDGISGDGITPFAIEYSTDAGNIAVPGLDGNLFVPAQVVNTALPVTGDGTGGAPVGLFFSGDAGNNATTGTDGGVFVPTGSATVSTQGPCVVGDGSAGAPIDVVASPTGGINCGVSGLEVVADPEQSIAVGAAGVRVLRDPVGGLGVSAAGVRQTALMNQRSISSNIARVNNEWRWQGVALFGTVLANDLPAAYGSWTTASGLWTCATDSLLAVGLAMNVPVSPATHRGYGIIAQRNNLTVAEGAHMVGVGGTGSLTAFNSEQARRKAVSIMQFAAGNTCRPTMSIFQSGPNGTLFLFQVNFSFTWLGDLR